MQAEVSWMVGLIALVVGAAMGWLVSALRHRTQTATAVASAQAAKDIELATLHERLRAEEAQLQAAMDRLSPPAEYSPDPPVEYSPV